MVDGRGGGRPGGARDAGGCALPWQTNAAIVVELLVHVISLPCEVDRAFDLNGPTTSVRDGVYGAATYNTGFTGSMAQRGQFAASRATGSPSGPRGVRVEAGRQCPVADRRSVSRLRVQPVAPV